MDQVKKDLNDRFKHFQTQEATTVKLEKILEAREQNLEAARKKLDVMLDAKRQLEVSVENLQARMQMLQVAEASSQYSINDSALSRVRETIDEIATRIEVAEKTLDQQELISGIPVADDDTPADLVEQITAYFGHDVHEAVAEIHQ
jgi:Rad3-related DNA helicase